MRAYHPRPAGGVEFDGITADARIGAAVILVLNLVLLYQAAGGSIPFIA